MFGMLKQKSTRDLIQLLEEQLFFAYETLENVKEFERDIARGDISVYSSKSPGEPPPLRSYDREFRQYYPVYQQSPYASAQTIYSLAQEIANRLVAERSIPPKSLRSFEAAFKMVNRTNKITSQAKWLAKAAETLPVLLDGETWPEVTEAAFEINNVSVINQTKHDVTKMETLIQRATDLISNSGINNASRSVDGATVWILSDMNRKRTVLADYVVSKDLIRLYYVKRFRGDELHSLIHEWGHRLWNKFLSNELKERWIQHHFEVSRSKGTPELPKVGDKLDFVRGKPVVSKIDHDKVWFSEVKYISKSKILDFLAQRAAFPTDYSATNHEEHFCEAFALYCAGKLEKPHKTAFERIFVRGLNESKRREPKRLINIIWG